LVKPAVSVMAKTVLQLKNPNGWYCLKGRTSVLGKIEIQLDTTRIRRRLDSKLDSIMGMVPAGLR